MKSRAKQRIEKFAFGGEGENDPNKPKKERIPLPDYKNADSRLEYAKAWTKKYGNLMSGRGDTPLRINEKPAYGTDTAKNLTSRYAKRFKIDPALFYASTMEEGMSGIFPFKDKASGQMVVKSTLNKDYPVSGLWSFGLDSFPDKVDALVEKGYLPEEIYDQFDFGTDAGSTGDGWSTLFKSSDAAIQASAAMFQTHYDDVDSYVKKKKIKLSPEQRNFFALASFNAGEGVGRQMIDDYMINNQYGNTFLTKRPVSGKGLKEGSYKQVYENVIRRIQMADALKAEGYYDDYLTELQKEEEMAKKKTTTEGKFANGGEAEAGGSGANWGAAAGQMLPQLGNLLMTIFDKQGYQKQPIVNGQTAYNMNSPYAFGGEASDIDDETYQRFLDSLFDFEAEAEEMDEEITAEDDAIEMGIGEEEEDEDGELFAMGGKAKKKGIHIKPSKKGTFTAAAKKHGKSVQGFASQVLANKENYSPAMVKKANFARNASKWKHANGGVAGDVPIEVEGEEVLQYPDGSMVQMQGPSHEQGGIDVNVPDGTKIYSDRLTIEGKTMQQRKKAREKTLAKVASYLEKNPTDAISKSSFERTKQNVDMEDAQDMALQKIANKIYSAPQQEEFAMGGDVYALGGDPYQDYMNQLLGLNQSTTIPFKPGYTPNANTSVGGGIEPSAPIGTTPVTYKSPADVAGKAFISAPKAPSLAVPAEPEEQYGDAASLTLGDYIGLGANAFNAIAPLINTMNNAANTKPEVNRFIGFGREAIEANDKAQDFAGLQAGQAKRELDTSFGSAILRNRLGASSINTTRALDTAADIARNKAIGDINLGYANQMSALLGQRGQLTNQRDQMIMSGATARDEREAQNIDNYYSNMAENLVNLGTNVGAIGRNLNVSQANKDNTALLEQMSEYFDFGRNSKGRLVLRNKKKTK